ncbi:MAG: hypothetical protein L6435_18770 [Anaerolineae bacterium]|nr:hypothetical protein [Anaerolineae bacterium]
MATNIRLGFFAYPWDLLDEGIDIALDAMAERCQCNAIALSASYHSGRLFRPRMNGPVTCQRSGAMVAFIPNSSHYEAGAPLPAVDRRLTEAKVLKRARERCAARNIDFGLWVVGLHNSTLGNADPDLCMLNCFGDIYTYTLCPANPRARAYLRGLVTDVCAQFHPQRILLEAIGYLGIQHGVHHELFMQPLGEAERMLLSLCFCPHCLARAAEAGVDGQTAQKQARRWARNLLAEERGCLPVDYTVAEMPALLAESPDLYAYLHVRAETTASLVAEVHEIVAAHGARLETMPTSFVRPTSRAWLEGVSLRRLAEASDTLCPLPYFTNPMEVAADLRWVKMIAGDVPLVAGLSACYPSTHSVENLTTKVISCLTEGVEGIYYFNYGLLSEQRLDWVAEANRCGQRHQSQSG